MSNDETQPGPGENATRGPAETAAGAAIDLTEALLRLLVGGAAAGTDVLFRALAPRSTNDDPACVYTEPDERSAERVRLALIGLLFEASGSAGRRISAAARVVDGTRRVWGAFVPTVGRKMLPRTVRVPYEYLVERGSQELDRWSRRGREEELRSREMARRIATTPVRDIVGYLADDPELARLVQRQARSLLLELAGDPDLANVIEAQGDRYVEHLRHHPDAVQELVRGQSQGLIEDAANSVRRYAVGADDRLERIVRAALMRKPREQLASRGTLAPGEYAGFASRLCGFVVDSAILSIVTAVVTWAGIALLSWLDIDILSCPPLGEGRPVPTFLCHGIRLGAPVAAAVFPSLYTLFFWVTTGQTPGKRALGVRIVRLDGRPLTLMTSIARLAGYLVSLLTVGAGFELILADNRRQALHDKIAGTCVVYAWDARQARPLRAPEG